MHKNVFVTGGSGILGRGLIKELLATNYSVVAQTRNKKKLIEVVPSEVIIKEERIKRQPLSCKSDEGMSIRDSLCCPYFIEKL